jgi:hypothetical protein
MIDRTLRLTWRKGLVMAAVFALLLAAHFAVMALFQVNEQILFLGATLVVPMWALSSAVYTFDSFMIARGESWRRSR